MDTTATKRASCLRAFYRLQESLDPRPRGLRFLPSPIELSRVFTAEERKSGGTLFTNINGMYASGQTTWTEVILSVWPQLGYIPEITTRPYREGEVPMKYVYSMDVAEWHRLQKKGELILACRRGKKGTPREKLTALHVDHVKEAIRKGIPSLFNINVIRLLRLDGVFSPPIPSLLTVAIPEAHCAFQRMRGLLRSDSAGLSVYGLPLPRDMRVAGIIPIESQLVEGVENLSEGERRERVIQVTIEGIDDPLSELECKLVGIPYPTDEHHTKRLLLAQVLFRQHGCYEQGRDWEWAESVAA